MALVALLRGPLQRRAANTLFKTQILFGDPGAAFAVAVYAVEEVEDLGGLGVCGDGTPFRIRSQQVEEIDYRDALAKDLEVRRLLEPLRIVCGLLEYFEQCLLFLILEVL